MRERPPGDFENVNEGCGVSGLNGSGGVTSCPGLPLSLKVSARAESSDGFHTCGNVLADVGQRFDCL